MVRLLLNSGEFSIQSFPVRLFRILFACIPLTNLFSIFCFFFQKSFEEGVKIPVLFRNKFTPVKVFSSWDDPVVENEKITLMVIIILK